MVAKYSTRRLPVILPTAYSLHNDAIGWASIRLRRVYDMLLERERLIGTPTLAPRRALLCHATLERADAEMRYRGTTTTLVKIRDDVRQIIERAEIDFDFDLGIPDLDGEALEILPSMLGIGQPESEFDQVNGVRCLLDDFYLDDAATHDQRVDLALLWASLPRAEDEIEFCGKTTTLDRIEEVAHEIAARFRGQNLMAA